LPITGCRRRRRGWTLGAKEVGRETWWLLEVKPRASLMRLVVIPSLQRRVHATRALVEEGKEGQEVYE
jgi:hypothetical protein